MHTSARISLSTVSRGFLGTKSHFPVSSPQVQFVRGARDQKSKRGGFSSNIQRALLQLSVLSAKNRLPRSLNLSDQDVLRHNVIIAGYADYKKEQSARRRELLKKQYESIKEAMADLKETNEFLFNAADAREPHKRVPLDQRIPTDFPPNKIWYYNYSPKATKTETD